MQGILHIVGIIECVLLVNHLQFVARRNSRIRHVLQVNIVLARCLELPIASINTVYYPGQDDRHRGVGVVDIFEDSRDFGGILPQGRDIVRPDMKKDHVSRIDRQPVGYIIQYIFAIPCRTAVRMVTAVSLMVVITGWTGEISRVLAPYKIDCTANIDQVLIQFLTISDLVVIVGYRRVRA
jgi:hypothetical protein